MPPAEKDRPGKVFVGGMAIETSEATLEMEFSKFGKVVEVLLVRNKESNVSRGFGFVTFASPSDADVAVKEMNGTTLDGKTIKVDSALKALHSQENTRGRGRGGRGAPTGRGGQRGGAGRGGPPMMRRGMSGPPSRGGPPLRGGPLRGGLSRGAIARGGPSRGGPSRGGPMRGGPSGRGRGSLLGDGRPMMMRGRGGRGMGPRGGSDVPSGRPGLLEHEPEMMPPTRPRGGYEDSYGPPPQRTGGERGLLSTPHHYEDDDYGPPVKRSRPESSYPSQSADDYLPARGGYAQEENGYGNHRAPEYLAERPSKHLYGRPPAREYGESRAELPLREPLPRDPVQPRDSVLGRAPRYDYGDARPELGGIRDRPLAREPASARSFPAAREAPRDYPPRERDPYAARASYAEPAAERDPYPSSRREPPAVSRGYGSSAYEERDYPPRADPYERAVPSYSREYPADARPPVRSSRPGYADPYADPAPAKDYGSQARGRPTSSYSTPRDSFAEARAERPRMDYGARDPFAASAGGARRAPPTSRAFERY